MIVYSLSALFAGLLSWTHYRIYPLRRTEGDNPTIGIILCGDTDEDIARDSILHDRDHLFASRYMRYMPSPEQLRQETERQKTIFYLRQQDATGRGGGGMEKEG